MPRVLYRELRFKIIDKCLRDSRQNHNVKSLTDACNRTLMEAFGIKVSRRTVQYDISILLKAPYNIELDQHLLRQGIYRYADTCCQVPFVSSYKSVEPNEDTVVCTVEVSRQMLPFFETLLLSLGPSVAVLEPSGLRQKMRQQIVKMLDRYEG